MNELRSFADLFARAAHGCSHLSGTIQGPCTLYYSHGTEHHKIPFPHPPDAALQALYQHARPAAFGKGRETVMDPSYRSARTLHTEDFAFTLVPDEDVLHSIKTLFLANSTPNEYVRAELYRVNIYGPGDFFSVHKDTPQAAARHFGSLVLCLPTVFDGGAFVLRGRSGEETRLDWGASIRAALDAEGASAAASGGPPPVNYVAFASDVDHWIEPVVSGYRVTVTFHLFCAERSPVRFVPLVQQLGALPEMQGMEALVASGRLRGLEVLFPVQHQYGVNDVAEVQLKGADATLFGILSAMGGSPQVLFYFDDVGEEDLCKLLDEDEEMETLELRRKFKEHREELATGDSKIGGSVVYLARNTEHAYTSGQCRC